jgi:hypothetical protein
MQTESLSHRKDTRRGMILALFLFPLCAVLPLPAQSPDMSNVTDVLAGQRSLLQIDDIFAVQSPLPSKTLARRRRIPFLACRLTIRDCRQVPPLCFNTARSFPMAAPTMWL